MSELFSSESSSECATSLLAASGVEERINALSESALNNIDASQEQTSFLESSCGFDLLSNWLSDSVASYEHSGCTDDRYLELLILTLDVIRNLPTTVALLNEHTNRANDKNTNKPFPFVPIQQAIKGVKQAPIPPSNYHSIQISSSCDNILEHFDNLSAEDELEDEAAQANASDNRPLSKFESLKNQKEKIDTVLTHHNLEGEDSNVELSDGARVVVPGLAIIRAESKEHERSGAEKKGAATEAAEAAAEAAARAEAQVASSLPASPLKPKKKKKGGIRWADEAHDATPTSPTASAPPKFNRSSSVGSLQHVRYFYKELPPSWHGHLTAAELEQFYHQLDVKLTPKHRAHLAAQAAIDAKNGLTPQQSYGRFNGFSKQHIPIVVCESVAPIWRAPAEFVLEPILKASWEQRASESKEKEVQIERDRNIMAKYYFHVGMIPPEPELLPPGEDGNEPYSEDNDLDVKRIPADAPVVTAQAAKKPVVDAQMASALSSLLSNSALMNVLSQAKSNTAAAPVTPNPVSAPTAASGAALTSNALSSLLEKFKSSAASTPAATPIATLAASTVIPTAKPSTYFPPPPNAAAPPKPPAANTYFPGYPTAHPLNAAPSSFPPPPGAASAAPPSLQIQPQQPPPGWPAGVPYHSAAPPPTVTSAPLPPPPTSSVPPHAIHPHSLPPPSSLPGPPPPSGYPAPYPPQPVHPGAPPAPMSHKRPREDEPYFDNKRPRPESSAPGGLLPYHYMQDVRAESQASALVASQRDKPWLRRTFGTKLCSWYGTATGCNSGDNCNFAHVAKHNQIPPGPQGQPPMGTYHAASNQNSSSAHPPPPPPAAAHGGGYPSAAPAPAPHHSYPPAPTSYPPPVGGPPPPPASSYPPPASHGGYNPPPHSHPPPPQHNYPPPPHSNYPPAPASNAPASYSPYTPAAPQNPYPPPSNQPSYHAPPPPSAHGAYPPPTNAQPPYQSSYPPPPPPASVGGYPPPPNSAPYGAPPGSQPPPASYQSHAPPASNPPWQSTHAPPPPHGHGHPPPPNPYYR